MCTNKKKVYKIDRKLYDGELYYVLYEKKWFGWKAITKHKQRFIMELLVDDLTAPPTYYCKKIPTSAD